MRMYQLETKREAINLALRKLAVEPMTIEEQLAMQGIWADRPDEDFNHPDGMIRDTRAGR